MKLLQSNLLLLIGMLFFNQPTFSQSPILIPDNCEKNYVSYNPITDNYYSLGINQAGMNELKQLDNSGLSFNLVNIAGSNNYIYDFASYGGTQWYRGLNSCYKSLDDGASWQRLAVSDSVNFNSRSLTSFINDNVAYFAHELSDDLFVTNDGGVTFQRTTLFNDPSLDAILQMHFRDENNGIVVVRKLSDFHHYFYKTNDGGTTWSYVCKTPTTMSGSALFVYMHDDQHIIYGGMNFGDFIISTSDAGSTWNTIVSSSINLLGNAVPTDSRWNGVSTYGPNKDIYVSGGPCCGFPGNFIAKGENYGSTWTILHSSLMDGLDTAAAHYSMALKDIGQGVPEIMAAGNNTKVVYFNNTAVAVSDLVLESLTISPNPCFDKLSIQMKTYQNYEFSILDMNGRMIKHGPMKKNIDISNFSKGQYIIQLSNSKSRISVKELLTIL